MTGRPFAVRSEGLAAIRAVQADDPASAATDNPYTFPTVETSNDTVTWDSEWIGDDGGRFCQVGHRAVIGDGKILTWTWPTGGADCP